MKNFNKINWIGVSLFQLCVILSVPNIATAEDNGGAAALQMMQDLLRMGPDPYGDVDRDGLITKDEMAAGTDYKDPDTDDDQLNDNFEVTYEFDPLGTDESAGDVDEPQPDGVPNLEEQTYGTNPRVADTDGDELSDRFEIDYIGTVSPTVYNDASIDHDLDGLSALDEQFYGSSPIQFNFDVDGDGIADVADLCLNDPINDADDDGVCETDQYDSNGELIALADNCPLVSNQDQLDQDQDGLGSACDTFPDHFGLTDLDGDGFSDQGFDANNDGDFDDEGDLVADNCINWPNTALDPAGNQLDSNSDGIGDACQCGDMDGDGYVQNSDLDLMVTFFWDAQASEYLSPAGTMPLDALERCDTNGDSVCSLDDLIQLYYHITNPTQANFQASCPTLTQVANRALARIGYGSDEWSRERILQLQAESFNEGEANPYRGLELYIEEQLAVDTVADPDFTKEMRSYSVAGLNYPETITDPDFVTVGKTITNKRNQYCNNCAGKLDNPYRPFGNNREMKLLRMVTSRKQLQAVLQDFWFNHFNIISSKGVSFWATYDYEETIQSNMHGEFSDLLLAVAQSPAMLDYLDLSKSSANNSNENYARELMELHTVGLSRASGMTFHHSDIVSATKVLTGWRYSSSNNYAFTFSSIGHDNGDGKTIVIGDHMNQENADVWHFGYTDGSQVNSSCNDLVADQGLNEGLVFMCLLGQHPQTADLVGTKLIKRFFGESALLDSYENGADTRNEVLAELKATWAQSKGDLHEVLRTLLVGENNGFKRSLYYQESKVKRPTVYVASLARALGRENIGESNILTQTYSNSRSRISFQNLIADIEDNGEDMYDFGPPTGYSEDSDAWLGATSLLNRLNAVTRLVDDINMQSLANRMNLQATYADNDDLILDICRAIGLQLPQLTRNNISVFIDDDPNGDSSYENRIKRAVVGVVSTPEFNSH